jgi:serine/threonine-protein kinase
MEMEIDIDPIGAEPPPPDAAVAGALPPAAVLGGRFHLKGLIGRGALGEVYRAIDAKLERTVAIRILPDAIIADAAALARLREDVQAAASLKHKNLAVIYGMGDEQGKPFITLEHVDGQSLRALMERKGTVGKAFSLKGAYNVVAHVCNALAAVHPTTTHGYLTVGNVLVNRAGRVKLTDFGTGRTMVGLPALKAKAAAGGLAGVAPEMLASPETADHRADLYSVGAVLYELLTGRPPAAGCAPASKVRSDVPREIDAVIDRCLKTDPAARFTNAMELKAALLAAMEPRPQAPAPAAAPAARKVPVPQGTIPGVGPTAVAVTPSAKVPVPLGTQPGLGPAAQKFDVQKAADQVDEDQERWLIQKDRLDFGPYSLKEVRRRIEAAEILGEHFIVDQETGQRRRIRDLPLLADFVREGEVRREQLRREQADQVHRKQERRRFGLVALVFTAIVLVVGGVVTYVVVYRQTPVTTTQITIAAKEGDDRDLAKLLAGIQISSSVETKKKTRRAGRRGVAGRGGAEGADVETLDFSKDSDGPNEQIGADEINAVMRSNFRSLAGCMLEARRRDPGLTKVVIAFDVHGNGAAQNVRVNGSSGDALTSCVAGRMARFSFPRFNGPKARARWDMRIQ